MLLLPNLVWTATRLIEASSEFREILNPWEDAGVYMALYPSSVDAYSLGKCLEKYESQERFDPRMGNHFCK